MLPTDKPRFPHAIALAVANEIVAALTPACHKIIIAGSLRRLKPTVAIRSEGERLRILCCMCMHPIAYYEDSWAGAMCPTDDVLAHLMLMRGDEKMFWRQSNQHPPSRPAAGL